MSNGPGIVNSPLSELDLQKIQEALGKIDEGLRQVELARRAGIDLSAQERDLKDSQARLLSIKQVYFPGR